MHPQRRLLPALALLSLALLLLPARAPAPASAAASLDERVDHALSFSHQQLLGTIGRIATNRFPEYTGLDGAWVTTPASGWTSGFLPGSLWLAYEHSGDPALLDAARRWTASLSSQQYNTSTHDVGFMLFSSYGNGYRITGDPAFRQVLLKAAESLATRYSPVVGCTRSWNSGPDEFKVIIDNMINLELLFWAARNGGRHELYDMAISHALKTRANHVRPDGSTYQLVIYDPQTGAVKQPSFHQGYNVDSTWSRGQSWAIYGFGIAYRESGDTRFLETARATADYFLAHLPADLVPFWDFQAPNIPDEPRDSSAAAVAASGLLQLSTLEPNAERRQRYRQAAEELIGALIGPDYLAEGTGNHAILLHGTPNRNRDIADRGTIYGDYYLIEAMLRYRALNAPPTPTRTATPSASPTATRTATRTPTRTATLSASPTATRTATPSISPTTTHTTAPPLTHTATRTTTPSWTSTATATHSPTRTTTPSGTSTATTTHSPTRTATSTTTATHSPTRTATSTTTATHSPTRTATPSGTSTTTATHSPTRTATPSGTSTATATHSPTRTATSTATHSPTATATDHPAATPSATGVTTPIAAPSATGTAAATRTTTATPTGSPTTTRTPGPAPDNRRLFLPLLARR